MSDVSVGNDLLVLHANVNAVLLWYWIMQTHLAPGGTHCVMLQGEQQYLIAEFMPARAKISLLI